MINHSATDGLTRAERIAQAHTRTHGAIVQSLSQSLTFERCDLENGASLVARYYKGTPHKVQYFIEDANEKTVMRGWSRYRANEYSPGVVAVQIKRELNAIEEDK